MLERYAAIGFGLITLLGVSAVALKLGGTPAALVSLGLLAIDALAVEIDRRAMFEPYVNAFSILAILSYLYSLEERKDKRAWLIRAGILGACAGLLKTVGFLALAAMLLYSLVLALRAPQTKTSQTTFPGHVLRRARLSDLGTTALITGYFLMTAPTEFLRQVYFYQIFRPADGTQVAAARLGEILGQIGSPPSLGLALAGIFVIVMTGLWQKEWGHWALIMIWAGGITLLLLEGRSFYPHYYAQLAVPIALLAGAPFRFIAWPGKIASESREARKFRLAPASQLVLVALSLITLLGTLPEEYRRAEDVAGLLSPDLRDVSSFLSKTSSSARVLVFQPAYALAASRPLAGRDGQILLDSYGYMQYLSLGLGDCLPGSPDVGLMDALHGPDAQGEILATAGRADYVVLEARGIWEPTPETIAAITRNRRVVYRANGVTIWR